MRRILIEEHWQGYRIYDLPDGQKKASPVICQTKERLFWNLNDLIRENDEKEGE